MTMTTGGAEPGPTGPLTVGPGLPDPPGLHWLLTGEFRLAVETGGRQITRLNYEQTEID